MSISDQLRETLGGGSAGGSGEPALLKGLLEALSQSGFSGLAGVVKGFQAHGLGGIVSSWIGTGENLPISPEQIQHGLGREQLQQLATKAGISPETASAMLAKILPGVVDKLTPNGQLPEEGLLEQGLNFLKGKLE